MACVTMDGVMRNVAVGTAVEVNVTDFVDRVFINRKTAGGEVHRTLLWVNFLSGLRLEADCPEELQGSDSTSSLRVILLAKDVLNVTPATELPTKATLAAALQIIKSTKRRLEERRNSSELTYSERKRRYLEIRKKADESRLQERTEGVAASSEEYNKVIEGTCGLLRSARFFVSEEVLIKFRQALSKSMVDDERHRKRTLL